MRPWGNVPLKIDLADETRWSWPELRQEFEQI